MHKIIVLSLGSKNFSTSLEELKDYLSFKLSVNVSDFENNLDHKYDVLLIHEDYLKKEIQKLELLKNTNKIKILISVTKKPLPSFVHTQLSLPISLKELNETIENSIAKNNFSKNSSIKIKDYILDKNEKKLKKNDSYILLTEKEIQLIELFLDNKKPIGKEKILKEVWKYAEDADTHTVETHIYRLRKKIKAKFFDVNFILNNKDGYHL
tara:strand:- start:2108 stop:2737 length:630 start_codon:yes stop_codon:yes gene_type:complete